MAAVVHFKGRYDPWHPADATGYSKVGYLTNDGTLIYPRRTRIARMPFEKIRRRPHRLIDLSNHPRRERIEAPFTNNVINSRLFVTAHQQMGDLASPFWDNPIKLPILTAISPQEHEAKWNAMRQELRKGDSVLTIDTTSIVSRTIAYLDQGTWSHAATYVGEGNIAEAVSPRVTERSIEVYHHTRYRLGVYRPVGATPETIDRSIEFLRAQLGKKYAYRKVIILGLRLALGIWPSGAARHTTPNMAITRPEFNLVQIV